MNHIYLDHAATTPIVPEARAAMAEALGRWHNPSSPHSEGRAAKAALEDARRRIASALGWDGRIVFTSGASEAIAIAMDRATAGERFASAIEHDAVLRFEACLLPVDSAGRVDPAAITGERPLVAVQQVNNETGVIQQLAEVAAAVRARGGLLLADCAQSAGKLPLPDADLIAISAHKFGGPPGAGALLIRDPATLAAVGGQEQGYRPGTENLPAILGMAAALEADRGWFDATAGLRVRLESTIRAAGGEIVAAAVPRISTIGAYRMPGIASEAQLVRFDMAGIAISAGSACSSGSLKPSHVLAAMGWSEAAAREVVRVSLGRGTQPADIDRFAALWAEFAGGRRAA